MNIDNTDYENLSPEEQEKLFHKSPFKEKGDLLMRSHDPRHLAQSLSQEELYLMTKEMDREERSEVIRYASLPQLFFVSDVDCWSKDRLEPKAFLNWLETLRQANERSLLNWLVEMDYETVITGLKKIITVTKPQWEYATDEALGDRPYFTLDNFYYIYVPEENLETVRRAIELLYENHRGKYTSYLEAVSAEITDEVEEEAFQRRENRLAERGFPYPEKAKQIYRPITKKELAEYANKKAVLEVEEHSRAMRIAPNYPVLWSKDRLFLDEVFLCFKDEPKLHESLQEELAWLSNKIIASEGIDFSSEERVRQGVERARDYVNIGLELLSKRDLQQAVEMVRDQWLEGIFRVGVTEILKLHEEVLDIVHEYWAGRREDFVSFLQPPYEFIMQGCLRRIPECYDPHLDHDILPLRDFKHVSEIEQVRVSIRQMATIHERLTSKYKFSFTSFSVDQPSKWNPHLFAVLGTLYCQYILKGKASVSPVPVSEIPKFVEKAFEKSSGKRVLNAALKEDFLEKEFGTQEIQTLRTLWAIIFEQLTEEFGRLDIRKTIDPAFLGMVLITSKSAKAPKRKKARA